MNPLYAGLFADDSTDSHEVPVASDGVILDAGGLGNILQSRHKVATDVVEAMACGKHTPPLVDGLRGTVCSEHTERDQTSGENGCRKSVAENHGVLRRL